jgi:hypothetical protein
MQTLTTQQSELNEKLTSAPGSEAARLAAELSQVSQNLVLAEEQYLDVLDRFESLKA